MWDFVAQGPAAEDQTFTRKSSHHIQKTNSTKYADFVMS